MQFKKQYEVDNKQYNESNQVYMCIKITKELKQTYERELGLDLSSQIDYDMFVKILMTMGYIDFQRNLETGQILPKMNVKELQLV